MSLEADLLIENAGQLLTLAAPDGPKRGAALRELGLIPGGAVAMAGGRVLAVGPSDELSRQVSAARRLDAGGRVVMPGFVDPHTHLVWAGDRADEFEMRIAGASYMEIMAAGGGIMSTVRHTRTASVEDLVAQTGTRLQRMLAHGTTTVEIKSGYGLNVDDELKELEAIRRLKAWFPGVVVPTFLAPTPCRPSTGAGRISTSTCWWKRYCPPPSRTAAGRLLSATCSARTAPLTWSSRVGSWKPPASVGWG
jgi:imidazolonepropionase